MDYTKQNLVFFHNFVIMKRSIRFLPPRKQDDLRQLTELIRKHIKDVEMVILFGSYARGTYVDYDQRIEFDTPTYFMSDYDILILTKKPMGAVKYSLFAKIEDLFFVHKNRSFHTQPQFIDYGIEDFNYALSKGHYFETEIKQQGIILYDSGHYRLARRRKLDFAEIGERAQKYFDDKFGRALSFFIDVEHATSRKDYKQASFYLHQATENFLRTIPMVFILYGYKDHDLEKLMNYCKKFTTEIFRVFPCDTEEEKRLFNLLQRAYIESRYNSEFEITKEDIDALVPKVEMLRDIVEKVCREQLDYYASQSRK